jgi:alpha-L-fucosidase
MLYEPTLASVKQHPVPDWFNDAKLGIFIHWGLYSVPAWAPLTGEYHQVIARQGWAGWFARNPYAEWYLNSLRISGSPTHQFHRQTYGERFAYDEFVPRFNAAIQAWNPSEWAELFQQAGARYVVLTTKHHDGFLLWPSRRPPRKTHYIASRDLVGELAGAVRARGLRMGLYYSGGLDWTFDETPIRDIADLFTTIPQSAEYVEYANAHWRELIERYAPAVLWNDIGYPARADLNRLFADYYNRQPDGVVNDRFIQSNFGPLLKTGLTRRLFARLLQAAMSRPGFSAPRRGHADYSTPEYSVQPRATSFKWEATRGLGYSFGYNRNEGAEHTLATDKLVRLLVDIVSKNGNLLLNVGPRADGTISELQRERLTGLGQWLAVNGEAIFGARPWRRAECRTTDGLDVRFTQKDNALYAILLDRPQANRVTLPSLQAIAGTRVQLLGHAGELEWKQDGRNLTIPLPAQLSAAAAYALRITPPPRKE